MVSHTRSDEELQVMGFDKENERAQHWKGVFQATGRCESEAVKVKLADEL